MIVDQKVKKNIAGMYLVDGNVDGVIIATSEKPIWFRRTMTKLIMGWKWVSVQKYKTLSE